VERRESANDASEVNEGTEGQSIKWKKDGKRLWRSSDGQIIADLSFTSGGRRVKLFAVFADNAARERGDNYTSGETLAEAKIKAVAQEADTRAAKEPSQPIDDFGEKIEGARKDYASKLAEAKEKDVAAVPLSESWPEPDYQKLVESGADPVAVGFARAARDEVPPKPRKNWKLKGWVREVEMLRTVTESIIEGSITMEQVRNLADQPEYRTVSAYILGRAELYAEVGHSKSLKGLRFHKAHFALWNGEKNVDKWLVEQTARTGAFGNMPRQLVAAHTKEDAIKQFRKVHESLNEQPAQGKNTRFDIYSNRHDKTDIFIGKKIGSGIVRIKEGFKSVKEARAYLSTNQETLEGVLARMKQIPNHRKAANSPRVGKDHRNGGDVTPEAFAETFGFRGVQFGNYVEQGRRQQDLNNAYDGLMDLAGILNIPAKALSLNGELGLAFGARGKGGKNPAKAHYEGSNIVINLTKKAGAGSLAHEWFHSLDNYFGRARGGKPTGKFATDGQPDAAVRPEVVDAFRNIRQTVNRIRLRERSERLDRVRTKTYWATDIEMTARAFESYVIEKLKDQNASNDYLANIVSEDYWKASEALGMEDSNSYPYPEAAEIPEIRAAYDNLFEVIETQETGDGNVLLFSRTGSGVNETAEIYGDIEVLINPTRNRALAMAERTRSKSLRGVVDPETGKLYLADAGKVDHKILAEGLGLEWEAVRDSKDPGAGASNRVTLKSSNILQYPRNLFADEVRFARNDPRYMFAGPQAETSDLSMLEQARNMEQGNSSQTAIRNQTGWMRGVDGKWRYEINDSDAKLTQEIGNGTRLTTVGNLLDHPKLFAAYPNLEDTSVLLDSSMEDGSYGYFSPGVGITLNINRTDDQVLSTLLHEIQHAIQSAEGFARGGNSDQEFTSKIKDALSEQSDMWSQRLQEWFDDNEDMMRYVEDQSDLATYALMYQSAKRLMNYANSDRPSGVLRNIRNEMGWVYSEKVRQDEDLRRRFDELDRNWYNLPKRHKMRERNLFLRDHAGDAAQLIREAIPREVIRQFDTDTRKLPSMIKALERNAEKARKQLEPMRDLQRKTRAAETVAKQHRFSGPFSVYQALAGEIEARNTQARQTMTDEQRRRTGPEQTTDVSQDRAIVLLHGSDGATIEVPYRMESAGYRRTPGPSAGALTARQARTITNGLMKGWKGRPGVTVADRISEFPVDLRAAIHFAGAESDMRAALFDDHVYILAPRIPNEQALQEVILHETIGHYGLRRMLGGELKPLLNRVYLELGNTDAANDLKATYYPGGAFDARKSEHRLTIAEELIAHLAESNQHQKLWNRIKSAIRDGLRRLGFTLKLSDTDLLKLLRGAQQTVEQGGVSRPGSEDVNFSRDAGEGASFAPLKPYPKMAGKVQVNVHFSNDRARGVVVAEDGAVHLIMPKVFENDMSYVRSRAFRDIERYLWPYGENEYLRSSNNKKDIQYLKEGSHKGSTNHHTGESEGGLSVAHDFEVGGKYGAIVSGVEIGQGSDSEPLLDIESVKFVRKITFEQFKKDSIAYAESIGISEGDRRHLIAGSVFIRADSNADVMDIYDRTELNSSTNPDTRFSRAPQTNTPAFREWFGDSKVVDAQGNPLTVYHGAPDARFIEQDGVFKGQNERFGMPSNGNDRAFWFAKSRRVAETYADDRRAFDYQAADPGVVAAYIKLENPLEIDGKGQTWREAQQRGKTSDVIQQAREEGRDGVIIRNVRDNYNDWEGGARSTPTDTYVVFRSEQIKSATDNSGDYDPANPDIRFSRESGPSQEQRQVKFWDGFATQPLDRMFRALFDVTGLVDSHGRLKPGVAITEKSERILKEWRPNPDGHFAWMDGILETARHGLLDRYKLSDDYKMTWRQAEAYGRNLDMQAMDILKTLEDRGVQGTEAAVLQKILTGEKVSDFKMEAVATPIRHAIDDLGQAAVEYGIITREQFERNRGEYLHRSYLKHEGEFTGLGKFIHNQQRKQNRKIKGDSAKGRGIEVKVKTDKLMQHVPVGWYGIKKKGDRPDLQALNGQKFTVLENPGVLTDRTDTLEGVDTADQPRTLDTVYWPVGHPIPAKYDAWRKRGTFEVRGARRGQVTLWRDYTKAEREHMGEILDARYNIAKTFQSISRDLAMGKFFADVAKNPQWFQHTKPVYGEVLSANEARTLRALSKSDWVEVPDTTVSQSAGTKQWGALSGGFVRAEIWRDLNELDKMHNPGMWRKVLTQWKLNKTARSPVVHMNNVMSNLVFMDLADVRITDLYKGIQSYRARDEHWRAASENGAFEGTFINEEIRKRVLEPILDELTKQNMAADTSAEGRLQSLSRMGYTLWTKLKRADGAMTDFYQVEDELFRMATYMRRLDLGDSPLEAAMTAREQFLDYDIRAPWVNMARRTVLPFIAYTYRAIPVVAKSIAHQPWKLAKYFTIAYLANAMAYLLAPGDEDEERRTMRDDQQGMTWIGTPRMLRMPWKDEHDNPVFMDIRRWIPIGDVFDMNQGQSAIPVPAPIQFGGPLMLGFEFALNKQAFTGEEIVSRDTDTTGEAAAKTADWLYKSWMPSGAYVPGSYYWEKVWRASDGARDILGRPYSVPQALLSSLGIKVQPHDVRLGYAFRSRDLAAQARTIDSDMFRAQSDLDRGIIDRGEYLKIRARAKRKMLRLKEQADKLKGVD